jgi:predicted nucleic acid-binding Zn ribbon protein
VLKLSQAISRWTPAGERFVSDPLSLLQAGWGEIVGAEVAKNSSPSRVVDGTLIVVTRSAAWSHQLSFLAERVREAVAARLPSAGIERLRFRVGALPKRAAAPIPRNSRANPQRGTPPPAESAGQALERFARNVDAARRAKRAAGWKECEACGDLVTPSRAQYCVTCSAARLQQRALATARLLFEAPWLGFAGTAELVDGLCKSEYESLRSQLLKRWWGMLEQTRLAGRLSRDGRERQVASSYVVLRSKIPPEEIAPATVRNVLGDELHDLLYADE